MAIAVCQRLILQKWMNKWMISEWSIKSPSCYSWSKWSLLASPWRRKHNLLSVYSMTRSEKKAHWKTSAVWICTTQSSRARMQCDVSSRVITLVHRIHLTHYNKKAVLSQRWSRNAPYTRVPWKFSGLPDCAHGYYSQHFSRAFVRIDPLNAPPKFEDRSFIRSWDNRGYPKKFGQSLDTPTLPFLENFK